MYTKQIILSGRYINQTCAGQRWLLHLFAFILSVLMLSGIENLLGESGIPATRYMVDVERYLFENADTGNPQFYPVPANQVGREHYLKALETINPGAISERTQHGMNGPRDFMPVLVKYVETGGERWGNACTAMLKSFHSEMQRLVNERGWFWQFEEPAALIPIYRKYLIKGGVLKDNEEWFREMWLYYCRHLHVWDSEPVEWRGGCHRSMPEAHSKGLAAQWFPDIPEASHWKDYSGWVFNDFWLTRDLPQNDTGYMMGPVIILTCGGDQWTGDDRVYVHPGMKRLWERLQADVTPDGAINPYGPNGGYNTTADYRLAVFERLASKTRDGQYRWLAGKLFNYLAYQHPSTEPGIPQLNSGNAWLVALAWLFADENVKPAQPDSKSFFNTRMEAIRLAHTDKALTGRMLGNADPRDNFGHVCCSWFMSGKSWPDKLILRSGWNPGDFFGLVELHPTSFPANPGGIMGLNRWGAPFTQIVTSKGASVENRLLIQDLSNSATRQFHPDKRRIDEFWRSGTMPDIQSEVTFFKESEVATYATVTVRNMDGLPVTYQRDFIFVKNRFLATRESVTFRESFQARLAPVWNTQNIGPQIGGHWANTFISAPVGDNNRLSMKTPPVDLLAWFAPRSDCRLESVDRFVGDPRTVACPNQLRYVWEGHPEVGQKLTFTQVYYPHIPHRPAAASNNPNPNLKAQYKDELQATAGASGIRVLQDDPRTTLLQLELEPGFIEWIGFNSSDKPVSVDGHEFQPGLTYHP